MSQKLFDYMSREHGLTLLDSEMHEIELIVRARTDDDLCDVFAASALQGIVGAAVFNQSAKDMMTTAGVDVEKAEEFIASIAFDFAGAMMAERKKRQAL